MFANHVHLGGMAYNEDTAYMRHTQPERPRAGQELGAMHHARLQRNPACDCRGACLDSIRHHRPAVV